MADLHPYQRLVFNGQVVCEGQIDTPAKFLALTKGADLRGKRVLDVGCHHGMMSHLAALAGAARVAGIDIEPEFVRRAEELRRKYYPGLPVGFRVDRADHVAGVYDVAIASAVLHHDIWFEPALRQLARVARECLIFDVPMELDFDGRPALVSDGEGHFFPNRAAIEAMAGRHFGRIVELDEMPSPGESRRFGFRCEAPQPAPLRAVLISGPGGSGKSTRAKELKVQGFRHVELDRVFLDYRLTDAQRFVSVQYMAELARGKRWSEVLAYRLSRIARWLDFYLGHDVVVEGYDLNFDDEREGIKNLLRQRGWHEIQEVRL